jgi:hypothetical protein
MDMRTALVGTIMNKLLRQMLLGLAVAMAFLPVALALPDLDVELTDCQKRRAAVSETDVPEPSNSEQDQKLAEDWSRAFNQTIPERARQRAQAEDYFFLATYDQENLQTAVDALQVAVRQKPDEPLYLYMASLLCRRLEPSSEFCAIDHIAKAAQLSENGFYASQAALSAFQNDDLDSARSHLAAAAKADHYHSVFGDAAAIYFQVISEHGKDLSWLDENMRVVTALSLAMSQAVPAFQSLTEMCMPDRRPLDKDPTHCLSLSQLMTTDRSSLVEANIGFAIWQAIIAKQDKEHASNENLKLQRQVGKVMKLSRRSAAMSCVLEEQQKDSSVTAAYLRDVAELGEIAAIEKQLNAFEAARL